MISYEYKCENDKCEEQYFIVKGKISDKRLTECPNCGSKVERIITGGTGFTADKDFHSMFGRSS